MDKGGRGEKIKKKKKKTRDEGGEERSSLWRLCWSMESLIFPRHFFFFKVKVRFVLLDSGEAGSEL